VRLTITQRSYLCQYSDLGCLYQHRREEPLAQAQAKAQELLVEIYGWFTEGFDTADLQDAKALLDALI
jgi:hypothetical protein